jgi:hypothetical protein
MPTERCEEAVKVSQHVADEGNVPGRPSTSAALVIAVILLAGLASLHLAAMYGPSHLPRSSAQSTQ